MTDTAIRAEPNVKAVVPERRSELDAMGMLVVVGLVFFHSAQVFYYGDFYAKNGPPDMRRVSQIVSTLFVAFAGLWGMPLMYLIAGLAIWYSLRKRTAGQFVLERVRRLFIPLVVGTLLLVPPMVYYELKADPTYQETYLQFLPRFFNVRLVFDLRFLAGAPPDELFQTGHLWFLHYLFAFTLLLLPLWLYLRRPAGKRLVDRLGAFLTRPWAVYLLALPIAVVEAALGTEFTGGWNRYAYVPYLIYGFLMAADGRLGRAFQRHRKSALVLGLLALLAYLAGSYVLGPVAEFVAQAAYDPAHVLFRLLKGIASWFWVVTIMGLAAGMAPPVTRQKRNRPGSDARRDTPPSLLDRVARSAPLRFGYPSTTLRVLRDAQGASRRFGMLTRYADEAQLPFYVLHMTPIVVIGFYVVQWEVNAALKYLAIALSSLAVTLVVYDIGVRRTRLTRLLFGMRPGNTRTRGPQPETTRTRSMD